MTFLAIAVTSACPLEFRTNGWFILRRWSPLEFEWRYLPVLAFTCLELGLRPYHTHSACRNYGKRLLGMCLPHVPAARPLNSVCTNPLLSPKFDRPVFRRYCSSPKEKAEASFLFHLLLLFFASVLRVLTFDVTLGYTIQAWEKRSRGNEEQYRSPTFWWVEPVV